MMKTWTNGAALMVAAITVMPTAAMASEEKGAYGSLSVGISSVGDVDVQLYDVDGALGLGSNGSPDSIDGSYELGSAGNFGGTLGYDFGMVRSDLEVAYSRNTIKGIGVSAINGSAVTLTSGDEADFCTFAELTGCTLSGNTINFSNGPKMRQLSVMGNLWFDIPVGKSIVPYVGGGVGIAGFEVDGEGKGKLAWQLGAGAAFNLSPKLALTADFRHRQVGSSVIEYDSVSGYRIDKIKTNTFSVGLRFNF